MNGRYIREMDPDDLAERVLGYLTRVGFYGDPVGVPRWPGGAAGAGRGRRGGGADGTAWRPHRAEMASLSAAAHGPAQERLTRAVAPLVQEKIEVLADFIPIAGWFFWPLVFSARRARGWRPRPARRRRSLRPRLAWTAAALERPGPRELRAGTAGASRREAQSGLRGASLGHERPERDAGSFRVSARARPRRGRVAPHAGGRPRATLASLPAALRSAVAARRFHHSR